MRIVGNIQCKVSNNLPAAGCSFECVVLASGRLLLEFVSGERGGGGGGGDTRGAGGGSASEEMSIMSMLVRGRREGTIISF